MVASLNDRLLFENKSAETDASILLGAKSVSGDIARAFLKTYKPGQKIILTGGNKCFEPWVKWLMNGHEATLHTDDFWTRDKEADYMRSILIDGGVDKEDIIFTENHSTNTGQNFQSIRAFILSNDFNSVSIWTVAYHQRRAIETCAKELPELNALPVPVYPFGLSRETWLEEWPKIYFIKEKLGITGVVKCEFNKLDPQNPDNYYNRGVCVPVELPKKPTSRLAQSQRL
jgi:uncharacterized SAM-binding protein YcdF (DUF218 family)